ncbi:MAG: fimbrillin family protein [Dysgonamonadaceae bacterium]|jgi:hypothetical protein|nr:fimbrillin family protein [Dysgonamonadaceae bacterium]
MKKKSLFLGLSFLAVAGLWTGCTNDETVETPTDSKAISFRLQGGTPSLRTTGTTVDYVNAFVVNAYGDVTGATKATMLGTTVYRIEDNTSNVFDYNPKAFYYAEDASVGFSAYSPVSKNVSEGLGITAANNTITYTVLPPDDTSGETKQEDLLVAYTKQTNLDGSAVSLNFKHALSRVYVSAENKMSENVIIESIKLVNLYNEGKLDIDAISWNNNSDVDINEDYPTISTASTFTDYKVLWEPIAGATQDNTYAYVLPASGVAVPAKSKSVYVVSMEQGMLILPQTTKNANNDDKVDANDFYLEITYKVANIEETAKFPFKDKYKLTPDNEQGFTFEFGRQYELNITFDNKEIKFEISVNSWNGPIDSEPIDPPVTP